MDYSKIPGMPDELASWLKNQETESTMRWQADAHDRQNLLESLSESKLKTLATMLEMASMHPEYSYYIRGQISMICSTKFNLCPCGENHVKQAETLLKGTKEVLLSDEDEL